MFTLTRILIVISTTAASLVGAVGQFLSTSEAAASQAHEPAIVLHDVDPRWVDSISEDLDRFTDAGLAPVAAVIHVWDASSGSERCHDFAGYFSLPPEGARVDICIDFHDSELGTHLRHKLVLHELAHAWVQANTPRPHRDEFMAVHGAPTWNDPAASHHARGTEIAANAIMYALHPDQPGKPDQICGYERLTGQPGAFGRTDPCAG